MADIPETIGKYKIQGLIAQGGMGAIYKSVHPELKRPIIIKKLVLRSNKTARERFEKEAKILLDMQSPYIVHLFDYFSESSYRYIVEEFVEGMSLDKLIVKQTSLPPEVSMLVLQDCCYGLKFAHSKGVVHRDIKPGNILISKRAEIKLADFGIATDDEEDGTTKTGVTLGTPAYMPPEQFKNSSQVDQRADIYALGVMLYEMVTGMKPYPGDMSQETFAKIRKQKYISPRKLDKNIPKVICRLIHKMLKPKASQRFSSVTPIIKIIKKYLSRYDTHAIRVELAKMIISQKTYEPVKFIRKRNMWKDSVLAVLLLGVLGTASYCAWTSGLIHKTVLRKLYTPVTISMKIPHTSAPASDIQARAIFFSEGERIEAVKDSERIFSEEKETMSLTEKVKKLFSKNVETDVSKSEKYKDCLTRPLYLKHGNYRAKVVVGSYVWWENFSVDSDEKIIKLDFLQTENRPITLRTIALDKVTGEDLTAKAQFLVLYGNSWIPLEKLPKDKFYSANVWKFKAVLSGYEEEIFSLLIDWYQDSVTIKAGLTPLSE